MVEAPQIRLSRWAKIGVVLAGYALAMLLSGVSVAAYDRQFTPVDDQAMGGMIAGSEMMLGCGVFLPGTRADVELAAVDRRLHVVRGARP